MSGFFSRVWCRNPTPLPYSLVRTYQALSTASVEDLWQKIVDLADVSWHPLLIRTNVPKGLVVQPGLIYEAVTRFLPVLPIRIFVERVQPGELLSVRILVMPGLEEQITYQVKSTVWGTCVSYSVTLRGWLSPLVWSLLRPFAARVAPQLVDAVEQALSGNLPTHEEQCWDF
ncbi:MAG TPA: SRPBCC family protein [Coleofasciculaceae cyanobacterium]